MDVNFSRRVSPKTDSINKNKLYKTIDRIRMDVSNDYQKQQEQRNLRINSQFAPSSNQFPGDFGNNLNFSLIANQKSAKAQSNTNRMNSSKQKLAQLIDIAPKNDLLNTISINTSNANNYQSLNYSGGYNSTKNKTSSVRRSKYNLQNEKSLQITNPMNSISFDRTAKAVTTAFRIIFRMPEIAKRKGLA